MENFGKDVKAEYKKLRENHLKRSGEKKFLTIEKARENRLKTDWNKIKIVKPETLGVTAFKNYSLEILRNYIDWSPFFLTWELKGKYPAIFKSEKYGIEAKKLYEEANQLLDEIISKKLLSANGVLGVFPANTVGYDDIEIYADDSRKGVKKVLHTLRSQTPKSDGLPNLALADFIAPKEIR